MSLYPHPVTIEATVWSSMPDEHREPNGRPQWASVNLPGRSVDCFLEGPSFDRDGYLWVVDIPYGRIFRISPAGEWWKVAQYDGWPNGLKIHRDGRVFIADYKHGIMVLDPDTKAVTPLLAHRYCEHFRGCNDLVFDDSGRLYFTDQGQSGMQMPNGRVYRYDLASEKLDLLVDTGPSPNGLVLNESQTALYVAMTRGNCVWRLPLMPDGGVTKAGVFVQLSGGLAGPDGMALGADGSLLVAHAGNGCAWRFSRLGEPLARIRAPVGLMTTNLAFGGTDNRTVFITESETGAILQATLDTAGAPMYSHS
ncbi:MAG: SMP-30/gluconolactonase/LRE family protein [Gammaproteobacteria bacterium]